MVPPAAQTRAARSTRTWRSRSTAHRLPPRRGVLELGGSTSTTSKRATLAWRSGPSTRARRRRRSRGRPGSRSLLRRFSRGPVEVALAQVEGERLGPGGGGRDRQRPGVGEGVEHGAAGQVGGQELAAGLALVEEQPAGGGAGVEVDAVATAELGHLEPGQRRRRDRSRAGPPRRPAAGAARTPRVRSATSRPGLHPLVGERTPSSP